MHRIAIITSFSFCFGGVLLCTKIQYQLYNPESLTIIIIYNEIMLILQIPTKNSSVSQERFARIVGERVTVVIEGLVVNKIRT